MAAKVAAWHDLVCSIIGVNCADFSTLYRSLGDMKGMESQTPAILKSSLNFMKNTPVQQKLQVVVVTVVQKKSRNHIPISVD